METDGTSELLVQTGVLHQTESLDEVIQHNSPPPTPKTKKPRLPTLKQWEKDILSEPNTELKQQLMSFHELGYFILPNVFPAHIIQEVLNGGGEYQMDTTKLKRMRSCRIKIWVGAKEMITTSLQHDGLGVLAERGKGRFDLELPLYFREYILNFLEDLFPILQQLCPNGEVKTCNVMISRPGSQRQNLHMDSSQTSHSLGRPPHYLTVLIPLTPVTAETGTTRVWPKSHHSPANTFEDEDGVDLLEPLIRAGDALIFDGTLAHLGTENKSASEDRYFFYLAFSSKPVDPNTILTLRM